MEKRKAEYLEMIARTSLSKGLQINRLALGIMGFCVDHIDAPATGDSRVLHVDIVKSRVTLYRTEYYPYALDIARAWESFPGQIEEVILATDYSVV